MASEAYSREAQFEQYITTLSGWVDSINGLPHPATRAQVVSRFIRDCNLLIDDVRTAISTSSASLSDTVDFENRFSAQHVQYSNLKHCLEA
jgi:16S rRNA G527 N7-methylase RsmG